MDRNEILNQVKREIEPQVLEGYFDQILINRVVDATLKAINYSQCCETLKDKEETAFDLWLKNFKHAERDLYWYNKDTLYCVEAMRDIYNTEIKPIL